MTTLKCSFNAERFLFADIILLTYKVSRKFCYNKELQSNLSTTTTLGTPQKWPVYRGGWSLEVFQSKLVLQLIWPDYVWSLLTAGCYLEVVVTTGVTVPVAYTRINKRCTKCFIVNCYSLKPCFIFTVFASGISCIMIFNTSSKKTREIDPRGTQFKIGFV